MLSNQQENCHCAYENQREYKRCAHEEKRTLQELEMTKIAVANSKWQELLMQVLGRLMLMQSGASNSQ